MADPTEVKVNEFTVGTTVFLRYKASRGSRVHVDFCSDRQGEILLHFNPRYDQNCLVLNTRRADAGWEREERPPGFPIQTDKEVHVTIVAESDGFLINYDGQRFCYKFRYRMPLESIRSIRTDNGWVKVGHRMTNCQPGNKIYIEADAPRSGRLAVDVYGNDAWELSREGMPGVFRPIHINPRFDQNCVTRNSHQNGRWEREENHGGMPIRPGERFIVCVSFQSNCFEIAFNGWHFATFNYRTQFTQTNTMILSMIEHVYRIKYV